MFLTLLLMKRSQILDNPQKPVVISVACINDLSMNILAANSLLSNDFLWLPVLAEGVDDHHLHNFQLSTLHCDCGRVY